MYKCLKCNKQFDEPETNPPNIVRPEQIYDLVCPYCKSDDIWDLDD